LSAKFVFENGVPCEESNLVSQAIDRAICTSLNLSVWRASTSGENCFFESGEQFLEMLNSLERFNECPKLKAF
jgi:hypothetical protein